MMDKSEAEKRGFREWEEGLLSFAVSRLRKPLWFRDLDFLFCFVYLVFFFLLLVVCLLQYVTL